MHKIILDRKQEQLRKTIENNLAIIKRKELSGARLERAFEEMSDAAHRLHMSLNPKPKHSRKMIENRGMDPSNSNFYCHIHPVEDLLAYLDDIHANDDLEDQTIDKEFRLKIYSTKAEDYLEYKLIRTENGWSFSSSCWEGECDKDGHPFLFKALRRDAIKYPNRLDLYLGWVWDSAQDKCLSENDLQRALDELGEWISLCEKNAPRSSFWEGML